MATNDENRLKAVLAAYGADPARWPEADKAALKQLIEAGDGLAEGVQAARELDQVLGTASRPAPPSGAQARLAELARNTPQDPPVSTANVISSPFGVSRFAAVSTLAASLVIGVYMGAIGTLDPVLDGSTGFGIVSELDDFDDPFELESLIGNNDEGNG